MTTDSIENISFGGDIVIIGDAPQVYLSIYLPNGAAISLWMSVKKAQELAAHVSALTRKEPE